MLELLEKGELLTHSLTHSLTTSNQEMLAHLKSTVRFDQLKNLQKFYEILDCGSFCLEEVAAWPLAKLVQDCDLSRNI